jgi:hypothetical protein
MRAKLIKNHYGFEYFLADERGMAIATSDNGKLSKQNCDEIFGVVDVEKLAEENAKIKEGFVIESSQVAPYRLGFRNGFNKAVELNGDKRFTLDDIKKVFAKTIENSPSMESHTRMISNIEYRHFIMNEIYDKIIQSLKQPTEIEVEIEMVKVVDKTKMIGAVKGVKGSGHKIKTHKSVPKLDEKGCLILKQRKQ